MGNSSTKEQRPVHPSLRHHVSNQRGQSSSSPTSGNGPSSSSQNPDRNAPTLHHSRRGGSRVDLAALGLSSSSSHGRDRDRDREHGGQEVRKETKQERDARRLERERVARLKERERSMREEHVDGGFLVTQGVYTGIEDYSKSAVRQLMIERRIAPFWRGLNDHSGTWKDHQLIAAARGLPVPAATDIPLENSTLHPIPSLESPPAETSSKGLKIPTISHKHSDTMPSLSPSHPAFSFPSSGSPMASPTNASSSPFRPRSKTVATLTTLSKGSHHGDITPSEIQLPPDPLVDGRPIEAVLYAEASECPICFLYYPPYLNKTRCCDQPICSECFVQIKRPDPHPPEHADPTSATAGTGAAANTTATTGASSTTPATETRNELDGALVSEPAGCPFCVQPEFGITYEAPTFRRGLAYANQHEGQSLNRITSVMSSSSSLSSTSVPTNGLPPSSPTFPGRRRTTSLSVNDTSVITTDKIRPDWAQKLASAKAQQARRSAAATALHAAAYLMNSSEGRAGGFGGFSRRNRHRHHASAGEGPSQEGGVMSLSSLSGLGDRQAARGDSSGPGNSENDSDGAGPSARRTRIEDLEEMMMMEAIRMSLVTEEDRRRKEEKEAKKEAKTKEKERKKSDKAAKKGLLGGESADDLPVEAEDPSTIGLAITVEDESPAAGKGKHVDRSGNQPSPVGSLAGSSHASSAAIPVARGPSKAVDRNLSPSSDTLQPSSSNPGSDAYRPSHLRQVSNTSSTASSFVDSGLDSAHNGAPGSSSSLEASSSAGYGDDVLPGTALPAGTTPATSSHNYSSLAAMIGKEDRWKDGVHVEHATQGPDDDDSGPGRDRSTEGATCAAHV